MELRKTKKELELEKLIKYETEEIPSDVDFEDAMEEYDKLKKEVFKLDAEYEKLIDDITLEEIENTKILTKIPINQLDAKTDFYELLRLESSENDGESFKKLNKIQIVAQAKKWAKLLSLEYPFLIDDKYTSECVDIRIIPRGNFNGGYIEDFNIWKLNRNGFRRLIDIIDRFGHKNYCFFTGVYCMERNEKDDKPATVKLSNAQYTQKITIDLDKMTFEEYSKYKQMLVSVGLEPSLVEFSGFGYQVRFYLMEKCYDKEALKKVSYSLATKGIRVDLSMDNPSKVDRTYPSFNNKLFAQNFKENLIDKLHLANKVQPIPVQIIEYNERRYTLSEILEKIEKMPTPCESELKAIFADKEIERINNYLEVMKEQLNLNSISIKTEEISINIDELVEKKVKDILGKVIKLDDKTNEKKEKEYDTKEEISRKIKEGKPFKYKKVGKSKDKKTIIELNREEEKEPLNQEQFQELQQWYGEVKGLNLYKLPVAVQYALLGADEKRWFTFNALVPFLQNCYFTYVCRQNFSQDELLIKIQEIMRIWNERCKKYENGKKVDEEVEKLFSKNVRTKNDTWGHWGPIQFLFGARRIPEYHFDASKAKLSMRNAKNIIIPNPLYKNLKFLVGDEVKLYIIMSIALSKEKMIEWTMRDLLAVFKCSRPSMIKYLNNLIEINLIEEVSTKGRKKVYKVVEFESYQLVEMGCDTFSIGDIEAIVNKARIPAHIRIYLTIVYFSQINNNGEYFDQHHEAISNFLGMEENTVSEYTTEMKKLDMFKKTTYRNKLGIPYKCDYLLYYKPIKKESN